MNGAAILAAAQPHLPTLLGLALGTCAKYGLLLDDRVPLDGRKLVGHLMMLGLLGLLSEAAGEAAKAAPLWSAIISGGAAVLGGKLIRRFHDWCDGEAARRLPLPSDKAPKP